MKVLQNKVARAVYRLSFGPGGRMLVTGGSGGIDIWEPTTENHVHLPSPDVTNYVSVCECDPLGRGLYLADARGGRMIPWSGQGETRLPGPHGHYHLTSLAVSADGLRLLLNRLGGAPLAQIECWTTEEPFALIWASRNGQPVDSLEPPTIPPFDRVFRAVALSPDGRLAAAVENRVNAIGPGVVLWDGASGALIRNLGLVNDFLSYRLVFAPDNGKLVGYGEKEISVWETATGAQVAQFSPGRSKLHGLAVHPSGEFMIGACADQTARIWDLTTLQLTRALKWSVGKLSSIAISPDGTLAAAGGEKGQVVLWDLD